MSSATNPANVGRLLTYLKGKDGRLVEVTTVKYVHDGLESYATFALQEGENRARVVHVGELPINTHVEMVNKLRKEGYEDLTFKWEKSDGVDTNDVKRSLFIYSDEAKNVAPYMDEAGRALEAALFETYGLHADVESISNPETDLSVEVAKKVFDFRLGGVRNLLNISQSDFRPTGNSFVDWSEANDIAILQRQVRDGEKISISYLPDYCGLFALNNPVADTWNGEGVITPVGYFHSLGESDYRVDTLTAGERLIKEVGEIPEVKEALYTVLRERKRVDF